LKLLTGRLNASFIQFEGDRYRDINSSPDADCIILIPSAENIGHLYSSFRRRVIVLQFGIQIWVANLEQALSIHFIGYATDMDL